MESTLRYLHSLNLNPARNHPVNQLRFQELNRAADQPADHLASPLVHQGRNPLVNLPHNRLQNHLRFLELNRAHSRRVILLGNPQWYQALNPLGSLTRNRL